MNDQHSHNGTIDYTHNQASASTDSGAPFSFSLLAMGAGQPLKYWAVPPTGYAGTDYQLGKNFGREIVDAAASKPKVIALLLAKAMMALPEDAGAYEHMLMGLFDCITAELARASAIDVAMEIESIELASPPDAG